MKRKVMLFLQKRNKRERFMISAIVLCALAIWASSMLSSQREYDLQIRDLEKNLAQATAAVNMESIIKARLEKLKGAIDKSKMLEAQSLQIAVEKIANEAGLEFSISSVSTSQAGGFQINSITLSTTPQQLFKLAKLEELLTSLEPYATLSQAVISGNKDGNAIIRYTITSFN